MKGGQSLNFTAGTGRSAELRELEALGAEVLVPEDMMAFITSLNVSEGIDM
jgi:hypothetical protein